MGKNKVHKSEKAAQTLSFFQSNSNTAASSKVAPESNFLQDAIVARQLLSTIIWKDDFEALIDQLDVLKGGDEVRCLAALNKLTSDKALIACVAGIESLTEQLAKELHNLILARSTSKKGKSGATCSNRKKTSVSKEASKSVSNGLQPGEETASPAACEKPLSLCKKENDTALSAGFDRCSAREKAVDGIRAPGSFSTAREAPRKAPPRDSSETEAIATEDKPLNNLLEAHGCTTANMQAICEQPPMELVAQPMAMPGFLMPSPVLRLLGTSKALALVSAPDSLDIAPIFIASRRRADVAHLNLTVPWMLGEKKHVVLITIEPSDEAAYKKWAEQSERHILVVLPEDGRGIGYARRWIQDVAAHLKLKRYWQMDDNVCAIQNQDEIVPAYHVMELLQGLEPRSLISVVHPSCKPFVWYPMVLLYTPLQSPRFKARFNERERVADAEWVDFTEQVHAIDGPLVHDKTPCWMIPYQPGYPGGWGVPDVNGESALPVHKYESREKVVLGAKMWYTRSCFFGTGHFDREALQKATPNPVLQAVYALLDVLVTVSHEIWVEGRYHTLVPWPLHPLVEASLKLNGQRWPSRAVYNLLGIFKGLRDVAAKDPTLLKWWSEVGWRLLDGSEKWQTEKSSPEVPTKGKAAPQSKGSPPSPEKALAAAVPPSDPGGQKTQTAADGAERAEPQRGAKGTLRNPEEQERTDAGAEGGLKMERAVERVCKASPLTENVTGDGPKHVSEEAPSGSKELAEARATENAVQHPPSSTSGVLSESTVAGAVEACQLSAAATELLLGSTKHAADLVINFLENDGYRLASRNGTRRITVADSVVNMLFKLSPTAASSASCTRVFLTLSLYVADVYDKGLLLQYCKQLASRAGHFESLYLIKFLSHVRIIAAGARHDVSIQRACIRAVSELLSFDTDMGGFEALPAVMGAMAAHPDDISIQFLGFSFLTALACKFPASDRWFMAVLGVASLAATAMKVGRGNESMQKKGYRLIQMLAESVVSLSSAAESEEAAKTGYEEKAKTASSAVQPLRFLDRLKSFVQSPAWAASNVLPTFIKTFREVINAIFGAFKSPGLNLQDIKQHCLEILRKHTSNEVAELMFSSTLAYVSTACSGQGDLGDWPEAFVAVLEAVEAFPSSSAVQQEGLAALTALLGGPVFKALCRSSQTLRFFHNAQESGACLSLDRLTSALVKVAVNFPRELQLLEVSMKVLLKVRDEDALKDSYSWRVISTSRYLEQQAGRTSHSFFVSTYVPAQTHAELLPPGPRFAPWTTSFDTTASSKSSPSHPLWSVSNILEQFEGGLTTRSLSQYWHRHKAELESKLGHIGQLADWPETPSVPTDLSETASYFQSEAFSVALQTMPPYSRAVVSIFVKLVAYTTVAVAALEAVAKEGATLFGNVKDEGNLPSEGGVSDLDLTGSACSIMGQTDTLLSVFIRDLKLAVTKALASKEGAAGNAGAQQRWLNFAKFLEAGSDDEDEATEETINPSQGEAGETEQGESATGPLGSQTVVTESEGEMVQGQESGGNSEGNFRGPALSSEEALQLTEQATVHISSLASLCLFPVALRKTLQALRPLLKAAYPASAVGWAAYALGSTFAAWNRLEPSVVGEALYDRPWFAAFLPPRRGELLCPSWRESGVFELFELLETWAGSAEKWTAVCAQDRRELVIAVQAFASVAPTFCVDASELSAAKGLAPVSSGLAAALRVVLGGEAHPTEREIFLEASILLAHKYPRLFYGGFSGAWLEDLDSFTTFLRLLTQPDTPAGRSWDVVITFLDVLRTRRSDIHRLVKKLKRGSKQGAGDLRDLLPESTSDVPLTLLRLRSEKLWEGDLTGEERLEELFPVQEVASRLFEAAQKAAVRRADGVVAPTSGSPEKIVEQLLITGASPPSATNWGNIQPNPPSAETPTTFSPGSRAGGQGSPLQPLFDSWPQPVVWDAAFDTMVMKSGEEVKGGPPLGLFRTCLLECMDSEALVFARELTQKLADEPSPVRNLRALSQLFAVVGHGAPDRPESAAVFIASGLVFEISITMTRFAPGGEVFSGSEEEKGAEERLGDLQRDGCCALSAILSKAAAERESAEAGERRVLTQLLESCEVAIFEVLQSAYWKYTPAELPEGAAEAGVSTPPGREDLGQSLSVRPRKDGRDAARLGLLKLRALLPETSPKFKAISGLCLAHDAIVADQAEAVALVTRADCLLEDGFGRSAAWYCDFWKRDWVLPSGLPSTDPEPPAAADQEPSKAAVMDPESVFSDGTALVPGPELAVEATAEPAKVGATGDPPLKPSASEPGVASEVRGSGRAVQNADAQGSKEHFRPTQEEVSEGQSLPSEAREVLAAYAEGSGSINAGASHGRERKASEGEASGDSQVASTAPSETTPGVFEAEARPAGAADRGNAIAPGKKASKKKEKRKQSGQAALESGKSPPEPSEDNNISLQPGASAETPESSKTASANGGKAASEAPSDVPDFVSEPDDEACFDATDEEEQDEPSPRVAKGKTELSPEPEGAAGRTFESKGRAELSPATEEKGGQNFVRGGSPEAVAKEVERSELVEKSVEGTEGGGTENVAGVWVVEDAEGGASAEVLEAEPAGELEQETGQEEEEQNGAERKGVGLQEAAREADDPAKEVVEGHAEGRVEASEKGEREGESDESAPTALGANAAEAAETVGKSKLTGERKADGEAENAAMKVMEISGGKFDEKIEVPLRGDDEKPAAVGQGDGGLDGDTERAAQSGARGPSTGVQNGGPEERNGADSDVPDFVSDEADEESEPDEEAGSATATGGLPSEPEANGTEVRTLPQAPNVSGMEDGRPSAESAAGLLPFPRRSSVGILPLPRNASPEVLPRSSSAASILQRPPAVPVPPAPPVPDDLPDFVSSSSEAETSEEEDGDTTAGICSLSGRLSLEPTPAVGLQKTLSETRVKEPVPPELGCLGRAGTVRTGERREQVGFAAEVTGPLEQLRQGTYQPPRVRTSFVAQTLNPASPSPPPPLSPPLGPETPASELEEGDFKPGDDDVSDADSEGWVTLGSENGGGHDWRLARDLYGTFPYEAGYRSLATSPESSLSPPKRPLRLSQQATRGAAGVAGGPGSTGRDREALAGARLEAAQQQKFGAATNVTDIDDGGWIDVAPRKKKGPHPLRPAQDVRFMEAQYFSEALPPAPRAHVRKRVRGNKKLAHRQVELRHARVVSGAALLPLPSRNQPHAACPAALLHPNFGLAAAVPQVPPHPKHAQARAQSPLNPQTPLRTKANTGRQYVPVHTTWADIPDPSDSATDTGTPLVGRPSYSPFAAEEPLGRRRTVPDPKYEFPTERLALPAGLPKEMSGQEPIPRGAPRQYAPSLHRLSAARPAALAGFLGGHMSESGRTEQPRAARQMAQYFSDVEAAGVDPRVAELLALRSQELAAAIPQLIPQPLVPAAGRPPRNTQKQTADCAAPGTAQIGRQANERMLVRTERILSDEGADWPQKAAKRRQVEEEADDAYCCICFENPKNAALSPCGHLLCVKCAEVMHNTRKTCHVCSKKTESVLKLFDSAIRMPAHLS